MKIVVIGASSGLGRSISVALGKNGDQLALLARRHDRVVEAAEEVGHGSIGIRCDVTDEASCRSAIEEAATTLGGIDGLVYAAGMGPLAPLVDTTAAMWRQAFDTNVVGAALITAAAIPHLAASRGSAAYLSSVSASLTPPWPGLGAYAVSKAALDSLVEAWRGEHPGIGFTRVVVGDCGGGDGPSGSEFPMAWDFEYFAELHPIWAARGYLSGSLIDVKELAKVVETVLRMGATASIPTVAVVPRPGGGPAPEMPTSF